MHYSKKGGNIYGRKTGYGIPKSKDGDGGGYF